MSAHHSEASPNAALELSGCACCQSVRMNLSPVLTDVQRKRDGAGKTRFCVSGPHVMRSVWPPNLVWICQHQLECQSFGEVDFGSALKGLNGFMGCIVFLLKRMDFCLSEILSFVCSVLLLEATTKALLPPFIQRTTWTEETQTDEQNKLRLGFGFCHIVLRIILTFLPDNYNLAVFQTARGNDNNNTGSLYTFIA